MLRDHRPARLGRIVTVVRLDDGTNRIRRMIMARVSFR